MRRTKYEEKNKEEALPQKLCSPKVIKEKPKTVDLEHNTFIFLE